MDFALMLGSSPSKRCVLARQLGIQNAVVGLPRARGDQRPWDYLPLLHMQQSFADVGLNVAVIESSPPMENIRRGRPGRDEEIEHFRALLKNMGRLGIPTVCYNFMAHFGWLRTSNTTPTRGNALVTSYNHSLMEQAPPIDNPVTEEDLWENFSYFLQRVVPVAEEAGVNLALHPDDPPLSTIRGAGRIFTTVDAFQRAIDLIPSPRNGITFCQGNFAAMGADIPQAIRRFGKQDRIHFVHFRDIRGGADSFRETFHDDGQTDMTAAMAAYLESGFRGVMRPDHVPTMQGDANDNPGYTMRGRLFAIGYMRGLFDSLTTPRQDTHETR